MYTAFFSLQNLNGFALLIRKHTMRNVSEIKRTRYSVVFHLEQTAKGIESEELCRIKNHLKKNKKAL